MLRTLNVKSFISESISCWLATVSEDGIPNVSPKEMFPCLGEDTLLIANIASSVSAINIASNSNVCVSFEHVFKQKGLKLTGIARVLEPGHAEYAALKDKLYATDGSGLEYARSLS